MDRPFALVIGESLIDVMLSRDGVDEHPGGSPMNVAVGLGRLGHPTQLATWLGRDDRGQAIIDHLTASGVQLTPGSNGAVATSTATVTSGQFGQVAYTFDISWQMPPLSPDLLVNPPMVVHTGSIGATMEPGADQVLEAVRQFRGRSLITFDPNIRAAAIGPAHVVRPMVEKFVALADVVKVSWEDLQWLFPDGDMDPAIEWLDLGPAIVVVTVGAAGSIGFAQRARCVVPPPQNGGPTGPVIWQPEAFGYAPGPRLPLVDTVGAGDAYMAALIDGLGHLDLLRHDRRRDLVRIEQDDLDKLMCYATAATSINLSRPGADPAWRHELGSVNQVVKPWRTDNVPNWMGPAPSDDQLS